MATNTKKSTTSTNVKAQEQSVVQNSVNEENEVLKKQLAELQEQVALMTKMMNQTGEERSIKKSNKTITFVNLTSGTLILRGSKIHELVGQFAKATFTEREAQLVVNNNINAITKGLCYIMDADFVEDCDLTPYYEHMLDDKTFKNLLNYAPDKIIDLYRNASSNQQEIIIAMIEDKMIHNQVIDANVLRTLSQLSGKDLLNSNLLTKE